MDGIGLAMGIVTIPMAVLTLAGIVGGVWLLAAGGALLVAGGIVATLAGLALAEAIERAVAWLDEVAIAVRRMAGPLAGHLAGFVCAALPMAVLLGWEYGAFRLLAAAGLPQPTLARWLWSYGVATWPWTVFAVRVGSDRRTLCGIRAYAGHVGYWLLSAGWVLGVPIAALEWLLLVLPAVLPLTVGTLLAVADRDALRNVRI